MREIYVTIFFFLSPTVKNIFVEHLFLILL